MRRTTAALGGSGISDTTGTPAMTMDGCLRYRLVLAVDIEGYSGRSARDQLLAQRDLVQVLAAAATGAGMDRRQWHLQAAGDGELAVLPSQTDVAQAVGTFPGWLRRTLTDLNAARQTGPRLRVRLALHHGTLTSGPCGPAGDAPIVVSRLLDARPLRQFLARQPADDLALAVSGTLFRDVVRTGFCCLDPAAFDLMKIIAKGISYHGYLYRGTGGGQDPSSPASPVQIHATQMPARPKTRATASI